jgi:signal recognition particle receptor subunit beta
MKIYSSFENEIHNQLRGNFKSIAERHGVSSRYVSMISKSKRELRSKTSVLVFIDLLELLKALSPEKYTAYLKSSNELLVILYKTKAPSIYQDYLIRI